MELATRTLSRDEYLRAVGRVIEFLRANREAEVLVAYGFGCDCPDDQLYQDVTMPVDNLLAFMAESEAADFYRVGKDNLHVKDHAGRFEFLLCHESDIHFITAEVGALEQLKRLWLADDIRPLFEKRDGGWVESITGEAT